jgi:hypothetical protein
VTALGAAQVVDYPATTSLTPRAAADEERLTDLTGMTARCEIRTRDRPHLAAI